MLFYYDSKIVFDFEITMDSHYIGTHSFFCEDDATSNFIPNLTLKNTVSTSNLRNTDMIYALSNKEHMALLTFWHDTANFNKLYDWNIKDWFISYIKDIKTAYTILHGDINNGTSFFKDRQDYTVNKLSCEIEPDAQYLLFDVPMKPEYSWAIEDCLYHRLRNTKSKYRSYVNKIINKNIHHRNYYEERKALFFNTGYKKQTGLDIMTIDLSNQDSLYYLYSPYPGETIRTSFSHIQKIVRYFLEKENINGK